jgi:lambda repressor-like predicted transcriptional regulator
MGHRKKDNHEQQHNAFIYIIQCCDDNGYVKIGLTTDNAVSRQLSLQVGCPYELKVVASFNVSGELRKIEQTLHNQLERFRLRGEWFKLNAAQALQFITASLPLLDASFAIEQKIDQKIDQKVGNDDCISQIQYQLTSRGLSLSKLADEIGINKGYLSRALNRKKPISAYVKDKIMVALSTRTANNGLQTTPKDAGQNWLFN